MNAEEQTFVGKIIDKIKVLLPEISQYGFKIKGFVGLTCCKDHNAAAKIIYLNPVEIKNEDKTTRELLKLLLR